MEKEINFGIGFITGRPNVCNIINSYSLNLSLTLAPTIGRITKAYSKLEFIATYGTKWNFSFNFSYYY